MLSAAVLILLSFVSVGYYHPDEHFQIMEFAAWKLNMAAPGDLAWEFHYQMRPALQPAIVVGVYKMFAFLGFGNPFAVATFLRLLSAALSFTAMWVIWRRYVKEIEQEMLRKWFTALSFFIWFALWLGVRFSSETWSGALFIIGFSYLFYKERTPVLSNYLVTGLLMGASAVVRYQSGILFAGFFGWFLLIRREKFSNLALIATGFLILVSVGILIDRWFYGQWTLTVVNYFRQNIIEDKVSGFGIEPWWFYFMDIFNRAIPPFSIVYLIAVPLFFLNRRKDLLTWTLLPFILVHFLIGHKESRFFFPLIGFMPVIVIKSIEIIKERWIPGFPENKIFRTSVKIFWFANLLMIGITFFIPADSQIGIYKTIYDRYRGAVTLLYTSDNPYHRAKEIKYYRRPALQIGKFDEQSKKMIPEGSKYLVALRSRDPQVDSFPTKTVLYSSYPKWITRFNFNHWMDRTQFWYVYEVEK